MKQRYKYIIGFILLLVVVLGCTTKQPAEHDHAEGEYYTCPMHPTVVQDEAGECPICGMDLVLEKDETTEVQESGAELERKSKIAEFKAVTIDPTVVQNMGVRVEHVSYRNISHNIRTVGNVEIADDKSYSINLRFSGWIETIFADKVGQKIKIGEKLFEIYSPELITAQEEYLLAVNTYGKSSKIAEAAEKRLLLWNIPQTHLANIISENNAQQNISFTSPFTGYILHKNIKEGSKVKAGTDLYHIGNLDDVWIVADLYEFDAASVKTGQSVTIEFTNLPGTIRNGKISFIYPTLNPKTRTQKIRIELKNADLSLKPGMFATVRIEVDKLHDALVVPTEAIINSGEKKIVFLSRGNGKFESRQIQTGLTDETNYYTEVISGLEENEIVVVSGQFLMDSESQLQEAVQKLLDVKFTSSSTSETEKNHDHSSDTYFTCPMHPTIVQAEEGECPICGMDLIEKEQ